MTVSISVSPVAMNSATSHFPPALLPSVRIAQKASRAARESQSHLIF